MSFKRRNRFNPKRRFAAAPGKDRLDLYTSVGYGGNPEHKRNPGDFGLTPPSDPRPDKTLCDGSGILTRKAALQLLREGFSKGFFSDRCGNQSPWPQNVWAVTQDGIAMEAQLENPEQGMYHGYPMPEGDPWRDEVLKRWRAVDV